MVSDGCTQIDQPLAASGNLWEPLGASGRHWEPLGGVCDLLKLWVGASGSLWEPLGASGRLWEPLGASGGLGDGDDLLKLQPRGC